MTLIWCVPWQQVAGFYIRCILVYYSVNTGVIANSRNGLAFDGDWMTKIGMHHTTFAGHINTLRPIQNGRHFTDDIFKCIFLNENVWISIKISLKFVPKGPINNIPTLVQIMAWRRPGDKPLSEAMMVKLPTHICVTRPQWVKTTFTVKMLKICIFKRPYNIFVQVRFRLGQLSNRKYQSLAIVYG